MQSFLPCATKSLETETCVYCFIFFYLTLYLLQVIFNATHCEIQTHYSLIHCSKNFSGSHRSTKSSSNSLNCAVCAEIISANLIRCIIMRNIAELYGKRLTHCGTYFLTHFVLTTRGRNWYNY